MSHLMDHDQFYQIYIELDPLLLHNQHPLDPLQYQLNLLNNIHKFKSNTIDILIYRLHTNSPIS